VLDSLDRDAEKKKLELMARLKGNAMSKEEQEIMMG
jgi:hypothetical protein